MATDFSSIGAFTQYLGAELGSFGGVNVELQDIHYKAAIKDACDVLTRYKPGERGFLQSYSAGTFRYPLDPANYPGFINVTHVDFVKPELTGSGILLENPFRLDTVIGMGMGTVTLAYGDYALSLARVNEARRVFSIAPRWEGVWELDSTGPTPKRVFALYLRMPDPALALAYDVTVYYSFRYECSDDLLIGIPSVPINHQVWFKKYALAKAKIILGRIRNKFHGLPGDEPGMMMELDGGDLISEGREEVQQLEEELMAMRSQLPPILG